ncbi:BspA family leucine-rich repeat surface protein [Bifidobacterium sp. ESL0790]|uniref:BspA family leucine-rich repeat surface protein n=1 Tax=Bifidobacterium sp. ESL0790 TaxID=2983233 RepID=UPI0023FA13C0|nr:BspA family leucine-rich repeat surface protein [Bifidobacterium sp. ESL0790]WEV72515.1 BspA family leucine-rich repeat surface protein [Bifidobacterium sp. ESL0790]
MRFWRELLAGVAAAATLVSVSVVASAGTNGSGALGNEPSSSQQVVDSAHAHSAPGASQGSQGTGSQQPGSSSRQPASGSEGASQGSPDVVKQGQAPLGAQGSPLSSQAPSAGSGVSPQLSEAECSGSGRFQEFYGAPPAAKWEANIEGNDCIIRVHDGLVSEQAPWQHSEIVTELGKSVTEIVFENTTLDLNRSDMFTAKEMPNLRLLDLSGLSVVDNRTAETGRKVFRYSAFAYNPKLTEFHGTRAFESKQAFNMGSMFSSDPALEIFDWSNLDTSHASNMEWMFYQDASLKTLDLSGWDTTNLEKAEKMFAGATALQSIEWPGRNSPVLSDVSEMFSGDKSLQNVGLAGWATPSLSFMKQMFKGDSALRSVDLSGWDVSKVQDLTKMFQGDTSLESLDLSGWNPKAATSMNQMFQGDAALQAVDFSGWNISRLEDVTQMFQGDRSLRVADLSGWDASSVSLAEKMFKDDVSLQTVDLAGWKTSVYGCFDEMFANDISLTSIAGVETLVSTFDGYRYTGMMNGMFKNAKALKSLDLSSWEVQHVEDMADMFAGASALESIDVSGWRINKQKDMSGMFEGDSSLRQIKGITNWDWSYRTSDGTTLSGMFANDASLTSLDLSGWTLYDVNNLSSMFAGDTALETLNLTGWGTHYVTDMSEMFLADSSLKEIKGLQTWSVGYVENMSGMFATTDRLTKLSSEAPDTPQVAAEGADSLDLGGIANWEVYSVEKFDRMFMGRTDLTSLDLSRWKIGRLVNGDVTLRAIFAGDTALTEVKGINAWDTGKVSDMSYMFYQCRSLDGLGDLSGWRTDNVTNMEGMFRYDIALKDVDGMAGWNTTKVTSMAGMFQRNRQRTDLGDVSGWNTANVTQMWDMFGGDNNLTELDVSRWNTSKVTSMTYMFQGTNLKSLDFSDWNTKALAPTDDQNRCSDNQAKAADGTCKILPENLEELTVGPDTEFKEESFSNDPMSDNGFTGSWTDEDDSWASSVDHANKDLADHMAGADAGPQSAGAHTYRWQEGALISFNANLPDDATLDGGLPANIKATGAHVDGTQKQIPTSTPRVKGYQFLGWNTTYDGGEDGTGSPGVAYSPGQTVTLSKGQHLRLYAQWKAINVPSAPVTPLSGRYVLRYEANAPDGMSASGNEPDDSFDIVFAEHGNKLYQPRALAQNQFKVDGYKFIGWSRVASFGADAKIYRPGTELNVKPGINKLYAHWQQIGMPSNGGPSYVGNGDDGTIVITIQGPALGPSITGLPGGGASAGSGLMTHDGMVTTVPKGGSGGPKCVERPSRSHGSAQGAAWHGSGENMALPYCNDEPEAKSAPSPAAERAAKASMWISVAAVIVMVLLAAGGAAMVRRRYALAETLNSSHHRSDSKRGE